MVQKPSKKRSKTVQNSSKTGLKWFREDFFGGRISLGQLADSIGVSQNTLRNACEGTVKHETLEQVRKGLIKYATDKGKSQQVAEAAAQYVINDEGKPPPGIAAREAGRKKAPAAPENTQETAEAVASKVSSELPEDLQAANHPLEDENQAEDSEEGSEDWQNDLPPLDAMGLLKRYSLAEGSLMRHVVRGQMNPAEAAQDRRAQMARELRQRQTDYLTTWEKREPWRSYFTGLSPEEQAALESGEVKLLRIDGQFVQMGSAEFDNFRLERKLHPERPENWPPFQQLHPREFMTPPEPPPNPSSAVLCDFIDGGMELVRRRHEPEQDSLSQKEDSGAPARTFSARWSKWWSNWWPK